MNSLIAAADLILRALAVPAQKKKAEDAEDNGDDDAGAGRTAAGEVSFVEGV